MTDILTVTLNPALDVSATTEHIRPTSKMRCDHVQRHPGGGGINVARVLHRLGAHCAAVCLLGGQTGQLLAELLAQEGVPCLPVSLAGHTRESFTVVEKGSQQEYRFVLPGPDVQTAELEQFWRVLEQQAAPRYLVASGSLPPGVSVDFYAQLARWSRDRGAKFVLDSSGPAFAMVLQQGAYMLKPSLREIRELTGLALRSLWEVRDAALQWTQDGRTDLVVVSLGAQGALMVHRERSFYAPPLAVDVVGAVGAGDSFVAGMVWALAQGQNPCEAFRYGVAAASASLLRSGTDLCTAQGVHSLLSQVQCQQEFGDHVL